MEALGTYLVDKSVVYDSVVANNGVNDFVAVESLQTELTKSKVLQQQQHQRRRRRHVAPMATWTR